MFFKGVHQLTKGSQPIVWDYRSRPIVWGSLAYAFLWTTKNEFGLFTTSRGSVCLSITLSPTRCWCVCLLHLSTDLQDQCYVSFVFVVWPSVLGPDTVCVLIRRLLSWNYSKVSKTQSSPSTAPGHLERRICKWIVVLWCSDSYSSYVGKRDYGAAAGTASTEATGSLCRPLAYSSGFSIHLGKKADWLQRY